MARENRRSASASRVRIGMCINDSCEKARSKEKQEIRSGHDFVCSECGCELRECARVEKKPNKLIIMIAAAIILLVGGTFAVMNMLGGDEENISTGGGSEKVEIPDGHDLGFAVFQGNLKDGKPHDDNGVLTFKEKHIIESRDVNKREANPGEKVIGIFENGHLVTGTWYKADGNKETLIIGG